MKKQTLKFKHKLILTTMKTTMTKLEKLYRQIVKEQRRIEMLKNTKELDVDFMRSEIKEAQNKIVELQKEFDNEYKYQQS